MNGLIADPARVYDWIAARSGLVQVSDFIGIGRLVDGELVAALGYDHHQDSSCMFHVAAVPGGFSRALLRRGFWVPFVQWDYKCLLGVIQHGNVRSREWAARIGFQERLHIPEAHPSGGLHWLVMTRAGCPWLAENKKNE